MRIGGLGSTENRRAASHFACAWIFASEGTVNGRAWALPQSDETDLWVELACADVFAHAMVQARPSDMPALRRRPDPEQAEALPASVLKHADEQTVAGLAALLKASRLAGLARDAFAAWGLVAAPRFIGRNALAAFVERFQAEGAWGASPHIVPHHALHSPSGTISQVIGLHGPNLGVGGGPGEEGEAWLACLTMLAGGQLPGVLLVSTCWSPELAPARGRESPAVDSSSLCVCQALAVALVPTARASGRPRVRLLMRNAASESVGHVIANLPNRVPLARVVEQLDAPPGECDVPLVLTEKSGGMRIELVRPAPSFYAQEHRPGASHAFAGSGAFAARAGGSCNAD